MAQSYGQSWSSSSQSDGKFSFVKVGTQLVVLSALVLGLVAFVGNNKTVTLNVDGKVSSVQTFGGTVGQVVKSAKVELQAADRVSPSVDARVENGSVINVNLAKAVKVSLDGAEKTVSTTAQDVAGLVTAARRGQRFRAFRAEGRPAGRRWIVRGHLDAQDREHSRRRQGRQDHHHCPQRRTRSSRTPGSSWPRLTGPRSRRNAPVVNNMVIKVSRVDTSKTATTTEEVRLQDADHGQRRSCSRARKRSPRPASRDGDQERTSWCWLTAAKPPGRWSPKTDASSR